MRDSAAGVCHAVPMSDWHRVIRLQPGAPVIMSGAYGTVRRVNCVRETYAVHLTKPQRIIDVPFGSPELCADLSSSPGSAGGPTGKAGKQCLRGSRATAHGAQGVGIIEGCESQAAQPLQRERNKPPRERLQVPGRKAAPAQCFSSSAMMM